MDEREKGRIQELDKRYAEAYLNKDGFSRSALREAFPEAFEPEKHPAIRLMDSAINNGDCLSHSEWERLRSYFNDDGTLRDKKGA